MKKLKTLLLICAVILSANSFSQVPKSEKDVLIAIYNSNGGDSWDMKIWEDLSLPVNDTNFPGITVTNGHITKIDLKWNNLTGELPNLNELTNLTELNLDANKLSGSIPDFTKLTSLTKLKLSSNDLTGFIPDLNKLTSLKELDLSWNKLSGILPELGNLIKLEKINLSYNEISGFTNSLNKLTNLKKLNLSNNKIRDIIPVLDKLTNLTDLDLSRNKINGSIPNLNKLINLTNINISFNEITGSIPELNKLINLTTLNLKWNKISGKIPELDKLTNLTDFDLSQNKISGSIPELKKLTNLISLELSSNELTDPIPSLSKLINLKELSLNSNRLSGSIPNLNTLINLKTLDLYMNNLSGKIPKLNMLLNITTINLFGNMLSGTIPDVSKLTKLEMLNLSTNNFKFSDFKNAISFLKLLIYDSQGETSKPIITISGTKATYTAPLTTANNQYKWYIGSAIQEDSNKQITINISDIIDGVRYEATNKTFPKLTLKSKKNYTKVPDIPKEERDVLKAIYDSTNGAKWTKKWKDLSLRVNSINFYGVAVSKGHISKLYIPNNNLDGPLPDLSKLTKLTFLILPMNKLSGKIQDFSKLTNLEFIHLGGNDFSGKITSLEKLTKLKFLALPNNKLSGTIPDLKKSSNLTTVYLSNNKFSGEIPDLSKLDHLENLFLDNNNLTGKIPNLSKLTELEILALSNNKLSGKIPDLSKLTQLKKLFLFNNNLTGKIPDLNKLTRLSKLFLNNNNISGKIPELSKLISLYELNLDSNKLTGGIPKLNTLHNLRYLHLNNNELNDTIPNLNKLGNLKELDISNNKLTGKLPSFKDLKFLAKFNISNNMLYGPISGLNFYAYIKSAKLDNNNFVFSELKNIIPYKSYVTYSPQNTIKKPDFTINGNDVTFNATLTDANNKYQWYIGTTEIKEETSNKIILNSSKINGDIWYKATNSNYSKLTLKSKKIEFSKLFMISKEDQKVLKSIYDNTNGENWTTKWTDFELPANSTNYPGITVTNGYISKIELSNNNLKGTIPNLSKLTKLTTLSVEGNSLIFENLKNIQSLIDIVTYTPQKEVSKPTFTINGKNITFTSTLTNVNNKYEWYMGSSVQTVGSKEITFLIADLDDEIWYKAKNTNYPKLTLKSKKVKFVDVYGIPEEEGDVLKNIYDENNGANWTTKWEIDQAPINQSNYLGITVTNGHITKIELANNNLKGTIPDLNKLTKLTSLSVEGNSLIFENLKNIQSQIDIVTYTPQKEVPKPTFTISGKNITFTSTLTNVNNKYEWYIGSSVQTGDSKEITFLIADLDDEIWYKAKNTDYPKLTLKSKKIKLPTFKSVKCMDLTNIFTTNNTISLKAIINSGDVTTRIVADLSVIDSSFGKLVEFTKGSSENEFTLKTPELTSATSIEGKIKIPVKLLDANDNVLGSAEIEVIIDKISPKIKTSQIFTINENIVNDLFIGTVQVDNKTATTPLKNYKIIAGDDNGAFKINEVTGELKILDISKIDSKKSSTFELAITVQDGINTSAPVKVTVNIKIKTSINKLEIEAITVGPNPVINLLNIKSSGNSSRLKAVVYNLEGMKVISEVINSNNYNLSFENMTKGIYILHILKDNKVIKQFKITK